MAIRTGVDIVLSKRFEKLIKNPDFLKKVYHASELADKSKIVGIFSLKEAIMKSLGKKIDWKEICIKHDKNGKPIILLADKYSFLHIDGSISHDGDYTIAFVILSKK